MRVVEEIRAAILSGEYDLTQHAVNEMAEEGLSILDLEQSIMSGKLTKVEEDDPRGTRYTIIGLSEERSWYSWSLQRDRRLSYYRRLRDS